jgi:hypothetical protein
VAAQGVDLDPMLRSAERFLQLWAQVRGDVVDAGPAAVVGEEEEPGDGSFD